MADNLICAAGISAVTEFSGSLVTAAGMSAVTEFSGSLVVASHMYAIYEEIVDSPAPPIACVVLFNEH